MGMHFFSPAHVMPLVECVRGEDTSSNTIAAVMAVTKRLNKVRIARNCLDRQMRLLFDAKATSDTARSFNNHPPRVFRADFFKNCSTSNTQICVLENICEDVSIDVLLWTVVGSYLSRNRF